MKLKKLLSEIGVEQMKVYSNPYATAFKPMEEDVEISKDDMEKLHSDGEVEVDGEKVTFEEGKKRFKRQDGIGKAKYTVSYHDGKKKHRDGSDFFDIKIFKNKKDLSDFVGSLVKQGYVHESVNESQVVNKKTGKDITRHVLDLLSGKIDKKQFEKLTGLKKESVDEGIASLIDQIRQDSKDVKDFVKNIFKDSEFKKMRNDKEFIKYLKSIYEGVGDSVNEADDVYHKSYTHAIEAAEVYARKKGYTIEDDEMFTKVGMNSKRPSVGKTTRVSLELLKNGKPQKKMLHIQVYGMKNGYELNAYIN